MGLSKYVYTLIICITSLFMAHSFRFHGCLVGGSSHHWVSLQHIESYRGVHVGPWSASYLTRTTSFAEFGTDLEKRQHFVAAQRLHESEKTEDLHPLVVAEWAVWDAFCDCTRFFDVSIYIDNCMQWWSSIEIEDKGNNNKNYVH